MVQDDIATSVTPSLRSFALHRTWTKTAAAPPDISSPPKPKCSSLASTTLRVSSRVGELRASTAVTST